MGKRKVNRTPEEEEEIQRLKRQRNAESQRKCRNKKREIIANNSNESDNPSASYVVDNTPSSSYSNADKVIRSTSNSVSQQLEIITRDEGIANQTVQSHEKKKQNYRANYKGFKNLNVSDLSENYLGKMNLEYVNCKAKYFHGEKIHNKGNSFSDCCHHGNVKLEPLPPLPEELKDLFSGQHKKSTEFLENIRYYNNAFSFASFNANLVNLNNQRPGPYCFKIQGQIYYQINTALYPNSNDKPSYGQLFILDPDDAKECRLNNNSHLDAELLQILDNIIRKNNIFSQSYEMMHEEICNKKKLGIDIPDLSMGFLSKKKGVDQGRYNVQRINEVAAIFSTTADGDIPDCYVTIQNKTDKSLKFVSTMDPNVEPWIYPMYYPCGTPGWYDGLKQTNGRRVTRLMYIQHRIAVRNENNTFLLGKRLYQQWLVDNYVKIEKDRLNWYKENQKQLRVENYQGLVDYLESFVNDSRSIGRVMVLPSSFIGSPRNMMQNYQDAMALVRKYGKPDIFLTMTCNPNWREIKENLFPGQQAADRPDICARVFELKKAHLIDLVTRQHFFGEVAAYVYVIEFQKRGLPHMHLLITLKQNFKITTPETVNKFISTEIPDPAHDLNLHEIVMKNMIHGPCGDWCLVDGKCSKRFPKSFNSETTMDENNYPMYRRTNTGITYEKSRGFIIDNRYVVPYCPQFLIIFNCHINVEIVSTLKAVKYLYKYIYKGHDAASVVIGESSNNEQITHDEIKDYIEARYVGPVEASWRILSKPLHEKSHSVIRLPLHLPNGQNIVIPESMDEDDMRSVLDAATMLIDYFDLNKRDPDARQYLYSDIPMYYVFKKVTIDNKQVKRWEKRQSHFKCIGRMYSASPSQTELFHLRLLLLNVKGSTSYDQLKTVNGELHQTYTAACLALGLIEDDHEWKNAMEEAVLWMMPQRLRLLFVRILMHCQPIYPKDLWDEFKTAMSEDYGKRFEQDIAIKKAYADIIHLLNKEGRDISQFHQMEQVGIQIDQENVETESRIEIENLQKATSIGSQQYNKLNVQQRNIVDHIITLFEEFNNHPKCVYIDGPGGSGKTFVYSTLYYLLTSRGKTISTMAFTGIAATLLPNGRTLHKVLGLPVPLYADSTSTIKAQSNEAKYLKSVDMFIWDEAPMAPRYALEIMDKLLKDLMKNDEPFGGKIVIMGGDFRQLLPVLPQATRSEIVNLSIKSSLLWKYFETFELTENMRTLPNEREFTNFLLDVGNGILNNDLNYIEIPQKCIAHHKVDIAEDTYANLIKQGNYDAVTKSAILSPRNIDVDEINNRVVDILDKSTEKIYSSIDTIDPNDQDMNYNESFLTEYLNTLNPSNFPPHELRLRKFTIVILVRNLNIHEGLCNGTRLLVMDLGSNLLKCKILNGNKTGDIVFLNRITLYCENVYPFVFKRRQFPVKLAFAMTINKSQGQTFERVAIDLRKDVFNHGQLYVALSRVKSWESLKIFTLMERQDHLFKNYVYKELFN